MYLKYLVVAWQTVQTLVSSAASDQDLHSALFAQASLSEDLG